MPVDLRYGATILAAETRCGDRVRTRQAVGYLGCSFAIGVFSAFNNFTLSLWLTGFTSSYILISLFGNTRSFEGAIVSPLAGAWSDRIWVPWLGRRRPFILVGGLLSALILAVTPDVSRLPIPWDPIILSEHTRRLLLPFGSIILFTLTFNLMDDIHKALLADIWDDPQRSFLSAVSTIVNIGSQVGLLAIGYLFWREAVPDSAFVWTGVLMAAGVIVTVLVMREPGPREFASSHDSAEANLSVLETIRHYRSAAALFLVAFFYWTGINAVFPLVSIYTRDILGADTGEAQILPGLLLLTTTLMSLPMAWLGTRYGKRRMILLGFLVMLAAALAGMVIGNKYEGAALFLITGVGNAAWIVLSVPLLADLVPRQLIGAASGTLAASGSLAAPLASLVGGGLADLYGPRAIFWVMATMTVLAIAALPLVKQEGERADSERAQGDPAAAEPAPG
jgi:MFS family permease